MKEVKGVILGTGIDLVDIGRIEAVFARQGQRFVRRILTPEEYAVYEQAVRGRQIQYLAGRFGIKEAVAKAFGTGIGGRIGWQDVITAQENGRPTAVLSDAAKRRLERFPVLERAIRRTGFPSVRAPSDLPAGASDASIWESLVIHVSLSHERRLLVAQAVVEWIAAGQGCTMPQGGPDA